MILSEGISSYSSNCFFIFSDGLRGFTPAEASLFTDIVDDELSDIKRLTGLYSSSSSLLFLSGEVSPLKSAVPSESKLKKASSKLL